MPTNNATDTSNPVAISQGGTNASSMVNTDGVVYYDGTRLVTTTVGTATQILTSNGSGVAPTFQAGGSGSSGLVFLASQTASNSSSLSFTSVITGTYDVYQIVYSGVVPVVNTDTLYMAVSTNNGSTYNTTVADYSSGINSSPSNSATITNQNNGNAPITAHVILSGPLSNVAGTGVSGFFNLYNTNNGSFFALMGQCTFNGSTSGPGTLGWFSNGPDGSGNGVIGVNALRFTMRTGNISTGTFSIYGIAE